MLDVHAADSGAIAAALSNGNAIVYTALNGQLRLQTALGGAKDAVTSVLLATTSGDALYSWENLGLWVCRCRECILNRNS